MVLVGNLLGSEEISWKIVLYCAILLQQKEKTLSRHEKVKVLYQNLLSRYGSLGYKRSSMYGFLMSWALKMMTELTFCAAETQWYHFWNVIHHRNRLQSHDWWQKKVMLCVWWDCLLVRRMIPSSSMDNYRNHTSHSKEIIPNWIMEKVLSSILPTLGHTYLINCQKFSEIGWEAWMHSLCTVPA